MMSVADNQGDRRVLHCFYSLQRQWRQQRLTSRSKPKLTKGAVYRANHMCVGQWWEWGWGQLGAPPGPELHAR